jgi:oligopeptide transport system substrate-binding protein
VTVRKKRVLAAISALAFVGLGLAACGGGSDSGSGDGTLRLGLGEPKSLIPPNIGETEGGEIADHVYAGLYDYTPEGELTPVLADGEPTTEDNKVWTIKIQDGFTFQNGEKITAETFVKTWNYATYGENANGGAYFFSSIKGFEDVQMGKDDAKPKAKELSGVKAVDDLTIEITLTDSFVGFPVMLGYSAFYPMADACLDDIEACNEKPIGNGMYKMDGKWDHKKSIKLTAWDDFAGTKPKVEKINYKIYTGDAKCWPEFEAGKIDICAPPAEEYESAKEKYGDELLEDETPDTWGLGFPVYDDVFSDVKVRKAFSMAIDRKSYIDGLFQGRYTAADSYTPSAIPGHKDNTCGEACTFDADAAKKLLDESSWPKDKKVELWVNSGVGEDYLKVIGDQLNANLGIDYELKTLEWPDFLEKKQTHKITGPFLTGWVPDYPLNENYMAPLYGNGPDNNDFGFHDEKFEQLLAEGNTAKDLDAAIAKYQEAELQLVKGLPVAPIWVTTTATKLSDNIVADSFVRTPYTSSHYDYAKIELK